jgi:hypothetical protein
VKIVISRSDVTIEAGYQRPEFGLFRDQAGLFARLVERLAPHGLKLSDMKVDRGNGTFGDLHIFFYLVDFSVTVRIRLDRVEVYCSLLTEENKKRVIAATLETFSCLRDHVGGQYRAYAVAMNIHGLLESESGKAFLSRLITAPPPQVGSVAANAVAYYLSPDGERTASSLTLDISAATPDGLFIRPQATWDAARVPLEELPDKAEGFVKHALSSFGIEIPE